MKKGTKTIVYDEEFGMEAYCFEGNIQPFPNHFHEYYVIGYMEGGERSLSCRNTEYILKKGDLVIFNPGDNHACAPRNGQALDYVAINIPRDCMLRWTEEITGKKEMPGFSRNVVQNEEISDYLRPLHRMMMEGSTEFEKEENFMLMLSLLIKKYGQPFEDCVLECRTEIENACRFMEENYMNSISLEEIKDCAGLSKSTLLRAFTKTKGVTPYRYLENIRINEAKKLLEKGEMPVDAAMRTGFSDQSHFTNYFNQFIGLSPGMYRDIFLNKTAGGKEI